MEEKVTGPLRREPNFDRDALATLARIAMGGRKIADVVEETGLSRSTISKIVNRNLSGPPSVDTLRRLAQDENSPLFRKMLEACGHSTAWQDALSSFQYMVREMDVFSEPQRVEKKWLSIDAMSTLINVLEERKYGTQFQIDYRTAGFFGICTNESELRIIGVPVAVNDAAFDARNIINLAIRGITGGIAQWGLANIVVLVMTNSLAAFDILKKMPNLSKQMAVLLVSEDGRAFREQAVIEPIENTHEADWEFPLDLKSLEREK